MNKILILLFFWGFTWPSLIMAQKGFSKRPMFAVAAGMNASNQEIRQKGPNEPSFMVAGWRATFEIEKPVTKRLSLITSFGYAQHGSNDVAFSGFNESLDYLELGVQGVEYRPAGSHDLYFSFGAYMGYGIKGERETYDGVTTESDLFSNNGYNRIDWGLLGNMGFKFSQGTFIQTGLKVALNNCYEANDLRYYNFAVMATVGQTIGWKNRYKKRG
jgi:hypothetical protein